MENSRRDTHFFAVPDRISRRKRVRISSCALGRFNPLKACSSTLPSSQRESKSNSQSSIPSTTEPEAKPVGDSLFLACSAAAGGEGGGTEEAVGRPEGRAARGRCLVAPAGEKGGEEAASNGRRNGFRGGQACAERVEYSSESRSFSLCVEDSFWDGSLTEEGFAARTHFHDSIRHACLGQRTRRRARDAAPAKRRTG